MLIRKSSTSCQPSWCTSWF